MIALIHSALLCSIFILTSCSTGFLKTGSNIDDTQTQTEESITTTALNDFIVEKDTLYDLLVAEIAAQRNQFNITLVNYILQARITRDPEIIKRAINAAQLLKDLKAIQEMALLWVKVEPGSIPGHQLLALQYTLRKNYQDAINETEIVLSLGGDARVDSLALGTPSLPLADKILIHNLYQDFYERHPQNHEIGYSLALVQRNLKQFAKALSTLAPILKQNPEFEPAVVLKINTLYDQGHLEEALILADDKYDNFPANHNLGRLFASMLIEAKKLDRAEEVFKDLIALYPQAPSLKLSHALVMLENNKTEKSKQALEELLNFGVHRNEANFYLGRIADQKKDFKTAVTHYQRVQRSIHFEASIERSSFLLAKELNALDDAIKQLSLLRVSNPDLSLKLWLLEFRLLTTLNKDKRSLSTLDQAITAFPKDEQLLYARAMTREANDNLKGMEDDLRVIISNNPQHAIALNALGYTLANRTNRLAESVELIKAALILKPENPMILDSMGWVLFKLGKNEEAVLFLLKAFKSYPDPEVAAHLGEALWSIGKEIEAQTVWKQALIKSPEHTTLIKTITRFVPYTSKKPSEIENPEPSEHQP